MSAHEFQVLRADRVDSSQAWARREIAAGALRGRAVFVAAEQSGGVGRFGRAWTSPRGGLWCTFAAREDGGELTEMLAGLGVRIGVACLETVAQAVRQGGGDVAAVALKWPNDVLLGGRKVLGVLTEVVRSGAGGVVLVGVGLNANFSAGELPPEVAPRATTLRDALGRDADLDWALDDLTVRVHGALAARGVPGRTILAARAALHGVNGPTEARSDRGDSVRGTLVGLADDGAAIIREESGRESRVVGGVLVQGE